MSATYFTDPHCPWSWAAQPRWRRLLVRFGADLDITYVMAGMDGPLQDPTAFALDWLDAGAAESMPIDPRGLLSEPPSSTQPAALAVQAVREQVDPGPFLRRLQEAIMLERRRLDRGDALLELARETPGPPIDVDRLRTAFGSSAIVEAAGADLERARSVDPEHHAAGLGRVALPSVEFRGSDGVVHGVYGPAAYEALAAAARDAGASEATGSAPSVEEALARFGRMTTAEVAAVCELPGPRAPAELWRAALEWRVQVRRVAGGEVWTTA